ncbi:MAG TPA: GMP/IMP nucleotidase [Steroidobacteraceae bacterium]|nr:GMP/IMP nucleotidase [Steroidobacteraceae bacterium]
MSSRRSVEGPSAARPLQVVPDWSRIDTVCLDMDGTVLDLHFDNLFWLEVLPRRWGAARGLDYAAALAQLKPRFDARRGTLEWYCVDHWSEELGLDVPGLKHELRAEIRYLDGAAEFLDLLRASGKRVLLTTNAHPLSLHVKNEQTRLARHFDELISSHEFGVPKEEPEFWDRLRRGHGVDVRRTLFVDDSAAVLHAALVAGVAWLYQVLQPDSTRPPHAPLEDVPGVLRLADLGESLRAQLSGVAGPASPPLGGAPSPT